MDEILKEIAELRKVAATLDNPDVAHAIHLLSGVIEILAREVKRLENRPTGEFPIKDIHAPTEWSKD